MKAMILAAGRGSRLRPLTDKIPKPLIRVGGKPLIEYHIEKLSNAGFDSIIINTAHLGEKIQAYVGDGSRYNIPIQYSDEGEQALETGGGIANALPLLGDQPFLLVNADIYCEMSFNPQFLLGHSKMHLVMVANPPHHPEGDFTEKELTMSNNADLRLTFSGVSYIHPQLFTHEKRAFPLIEKIRFCIEEKLISAEIYQGMWTDVGTASRLYEADKYILSKT